MTTADHTIQTLTIDGREVPAGRNRSLVEVRLAEGLPADIGVGCLGQGSCGACRAMISRPADRGVEMVLGCETTAEAGMVVSFLRPVDRSPRHRDDLDQVDDRWNVLEVIARNFPEAPLCRHCGGCDAVCPRHLHVEQGVADTVAGRLVEAAAAFDDCVMCDLCTIACPDHIDPNHLGMFVRAINARQAPPPVDLVRRLHEIAQGRCPIDLDLDDPDLLDDTAPGTLGVIEPTGTHRRAADAEGDGDGEHEDEP
jgi:ferredoxin